MAARRIEREPGRLRIPPQAGLTYYRISTQPRAFLFVGGVPNTPSQLSVSPTGTSILAAYFPISTTLDSLGLEDLSTWRKLGDPGVALESADRLLAEDGFGILRSYYYDGSAWRRAGSPADQGSTPIAPGGAIYSTRFGGGAPETWTRAMPYTLD